MKLMSQMPSSTSESGENALAILDGGSQIDMLVTDVIMPGMSGTALAQTTRRQRPELPVMLIFGVR
jgi:two-component system cell cycle sensor histidine kinase/response regulator CckA